ncbi:hypothetical protein ES707_04584 [subsurface metagenome]
MKIKIVISALIIAFVFASLIGCTLGPVEVEEITVCKNVDSNYKPVDSTYVFPPETTAICLAVKINNFTPKDKLSITLIYLETNDEIAKQEADQEKSGSGYQSFKFIYNQGFPSGRYNAMIYLNNELAETVEFSVE